MATAAWVLGGRSTQALRVGVRHNADDADSGATVTVNIASLPAEWKLKARAQKCTLISDAALLDYIVNVQRDWQAPVRVAGVREAIEALRQRASATTAEGLSHAVRDEVCAAVTQETLGVSIEGDRVTLHKPFAASREAFVDALRPTLATLGYDLVPKRAAEGPVHQAATRRKVAAK